MIRRAVHRAAAAIARATEDVPSVTALFGGPGAPSTGRWHLSAPWCFLNAGSPLDTGRYVETASYFELPEGVGIRDPEDPILPPIGEPPIGLLDLVGPETKSLDGLTGSVADVVFDEITAPEGDYIPVPLPEPDLHVPMTPAELKKYPHLARAFANERKPVEEAGSPHVVRDEQAELASAIAARTDPTVAPPARVDVEEAIADVRAAVDRHMKEGPMSGGPGRPKKDVRRTCPSCGQKSGGPKSTVCFHCREPFPPNPRKKNVLTIKVAR